MFVVYIKAHRSTVVVIKQTPETLLPIINLEPPSLLHFLAPSSPSHDVYLQFFIPSVSSLIT